MANPAHAMLSASSAYRWMKCTPSAKLESVLPDIKKPAGAFDYSAEGTYAHELAEAKLRLRYGLIDTLEHDKIRAKIKGTKYYTTEFEAFVDDYVLYVASQIGDSDKPMFEQKVDYSEWAPDGFGTADVVILSEHKVRIIDLKFGQGIPVTAQDNSQLRLYALGAWNKFQHENPNIKEVEYTIHQPRLHSISTDSTSLEKLKEWADYVVKPKAQKAWMGSGDFLAGDHCGFCKAKYQCKKRSEYADEIAKLEFREPALLEEHEMSRFLEIAPMAISYIKDVETYLTERAVETGKTPIGYKLGNKITQRKIEDTEKALEILTKHFDVEEITEPPKLKSISKLEKIDADKVNGLLGELIVKPVGEPKLVVDRSADDFS